MKTIICVWLDETAEPDDPKWIVSRDVVDNEYGEDQNTGARSSDTLDVCDTHDEAVEYAREVAARENLPLWEQGARGVPTEMAGCGWMCETGC